MNLTSCFCCRHLSEPSSSLDAMLKPKVTTLPGHIQSVYVQNIAKLYACLLSAAEEADDQNTLKEITQSVADRLTIFIQSSDLEVQDRVRVDSAVRVLSHLL